MRPFLLLGLVACLRAQPTPDLSVLASRAQTFAEFLPNLLCTETLVQKELRYSSRLKIRKEDDSLVAPPPKTTTRKIVSDFGYALDAGEDNAPNFWREVRKVLEVDGKRVTTRAKARAKLIKGLRSDRDRDRYRFLEEFTHYGLDVTVTDYSLSLLLFLAADLPRYRFTFEREAFSGADKFHIFHFERQDDAASVTVFEGKKASHSRIKGRLWASAATGVPFKIQLLAETEDDGILIFDEGTVEYAQSRFGPLVATRIDFVRRVEGKALAEALYEYTNYRRFGADAELKFDPLPETTQP
ncbi:MAG: hypothetical protein NW208_12515 [Bryobacter sp.]|nr:hypothetical protein [Bryobacter sp.]